MQSVYLKLLSRLVVSWILIRVELHSKFAISLLDFSLGGAAVDSQDFVKVATENTEREKKVSRVSLHEGSR